MGSVVENFVLVSVFEPIFKYSILSKSNKWVVWFIKKILVTLYLKKVFTKKYSK